MLAIVVAFQPCSATAATTPSSSRSRWFSATKTRGRPWRPGGRRSPPTARPPAACAPASAIAEVGGEGDVDHFRVERLQRLPLSPALEPFAQQPGERAGRRLLLARRQVRRGGLQRPPLAQLRGDPVESRLEAGAQLGPAGLRLDQDEAGPLGLGGDQ